MSTWQTGDITANGIRLHYTRTGGDKPPLVLAHGHSDNGLCWTRVAKELEGDYDLILYDARRHGDSGDGPDDMPPDAMIHDAVGLIATLGLRKPGLMGHSMGAATAAGVGALYPDLLSYIILEDVPWFDAESDARWHRPSPQPAAALPQTREEWIARCRAQNPGWHDDEVQPWADSKIQYHRRTVDWRRGPRPPWQDLARQITCPTLLLTGDPEQRAIVTPNVAQEALGLVARGQVAHIEGAGHCIHRDRFEETMAAVRAFLAGL